MARDAAATAQQAPPPRPGASGADLCPPAIRQHALSSSDPVPLLRPAGAAAAPRGEDYRHHLATTAHGWPRLQRWCVWIEPPGRDPAARLWEERWQQAVQQALEQWQQPVALTLVEDPAQAQVRLWRRRPPRLPGPDGRLRASHGRAILRLLQVERAGFLRLEPAVEVLISPAQRQDGIAATALHELGHAFGLWGHSDDPADAMAAVPGAQPVLQLSRRDRATLLWLQSQPTTIGSPLPP
ncbi:MAG: peptidase [Cyanobium sp.]